MYNIVEYTAFGSELSEWHVEFENPCWNVQPNETADDVDRNIALKFTNEATDRGLQLSFEDSAGGQQLQVSCWYLQHLSA